MSKQLVMENYVDECLDEVEIRDLYISEFDIMSTPAKDIIWKASKDLDKIKDKLKNIKDTENELHNKIQSLKKIGTSTSIKSSKHWQKYLDTTVSDKSVKLMNKHNKLQSILYKARNNPGMLGDIPYIYQFIGATAIVASVAYASYRLYKRFMSKAAKACQDKKGKVKTICMNQYQLKGLEASKKPFTDGIKNCSKAKEVQACKAKFNKKINDINKKITKKQNQIKKLASK